MSNTTQVRSRLSAYALETALDESLRAIQADLTELEGLLPLDRVHTVQEWGDLDRLQIGALASEEGAIGAEGDPYRPAEILCVQALERLGARWVDKFEEPIPVTEVTATIQEALGEAREPKQGEGVRPLDVSPSTFRCWLKARTYELLAAEPPARAKKKELSLHPEPLFWLLDQERWPDEVTAEEHELLDQFRLHLVEAGLPLAEVLSEIAWNQQTTVEDAHARLGEITRKMTC